MHRDLVDRRHWYSEEEYQQGLAICPRSRAFFFGVGPVVMAIIAIAAHKLARSTNKQDPVLWAIAAIVCAVTVATGAELRIATVAGRRLTPSRLQTQKLCRASPI